MIWFMLTLIVIVADMVAWIWGLSPTGLWPIDLRLFIVGWALLDFLILSVVCLVKTTWLLSTWRIALAWLPVSSVLVAVAVGPRISTVLLVIYAIALLPVAVWSVIPRSKAAIESQRAARKKVTADFLTSAGLSK